MGSGSGSVRAGSSLAGRNNLDGSLEDVPAPTLLKPPELKVKAAPLAEQDLTGSGCVSHASGRVGVRGSGSAGVGCGVRCRRGGFDT